jgi:hypothetical protein
MGQIQDGREGRRQLLADEQIVVKLKNANLRVLLYTMLGVSEVGSFFDAYKASLAPDYQLRMFSANVCRRSS